MHREREEELPTLMRLKVGRGEEGSCTSCCRNMMIEEVYLRRKRKESLEMDKMMKGLSKHE